MLFSLGWILLFGFLIGWLLNQIKIPGLVGMILIGLLFGPYCLSWIDSSLLEISGILRQIALIVILTRSGLNLDISSLKKIGRPAILMSFLPATFEIVGVGIFGTYLLHLSWAESFLLGSVLAAVSPAIVSPRMIRLIENGYGKNHEVPKLILAGSSIDDIYAIVLFYAFLGLVQTEHLQWNTFLQIPSSIVLGIGCGCVVGFFLVLLFRLKKIHIYVEILILLATSFLLVGIEDLVKPWISVSSLLAILVVAIILLWKQPLKAKEIEKGYSGLWKGFEILLFVLVGATVDYHYILNSGGMVLTVLGIGLIFRMIGVLFCLIATPLSAKERLFTMIAYLPKATVQASIGGIALSLGLSCGNVVLTVSVLSILITAPIGALLIDLFGKKLLKKEDLDIQ